MSSPKDVWFLGADPGLAHFGWALIAVSKGRPRVVRMGVVTTSPKRGANFSEDLSRRAAELSVELRALLDVQPAAVLAEAMSYPPSSKSAAMLSRGWGVLDAYASSKGIPVFQLGPQALKLAVTGSKEASKEDVQAHLARHFPEIDGMLARIPRADREHPCDALGAYYALRDSDLVDVVLRA